MKNSYTINLLRLYCYFVEEKNHDDVFLKYDNQKIWPLNKKQQPISMDSETELNVEIAGVSVKKEAIIELWDWDLFSANDKLGEFRMTVEGDPGPFTTDMIQNTRETTRAKYTLEWEVY